MYQLTGEQKTFLRDEFSLSDTDIQHLIDDDDDELSIKIYDELCRIEVEETLAAMNPDRPLSYRGEVAEALVTLLGGPYDYEGLTPEEIEELQIGKPEDYEAKK